MRLYESKRKQVLGKMGEDFAASLLLADGYQVLARNYRTPYGEIDLIAEKDDGIVFVEVKTRTNQNYGFPEDAITARKQEHLLNSAESYLQEHPLVSVWRVDVIAIECDLDGTISHFEWFENAIN